MKESRVSWATVTATASVVIAACALALSIWQGQLGRLQSRVAARPILVFNTRSATEGSFRGIEIGNFGQGAAFVRGFHVYVDHQLVPGQGEAIWKTASQRLEPGSSNLGPGATLYWQYWQPGTVIPAKSENQRVFGVTWTPGAKLDGHDMVFELIRRINIVFEYSSVYDETFRRCFVEPIRGALWNFTAPVPSLDARAFVSDETACRF